MTLSSLLAAALIMISPTPSDPRVDVAQGVLIGRAADGVDSFKGVPYAAAPLGSLRWRAPRPVAPWTSPRDAGEVGAICIQPPANGDNGVGPPPMSEDCLTLNVWTPEGRDKPLPVMVWIHGGGLNNGSGTAALYDGTSLAKRGVVVVTINYRLGRLGFFDHPALAAERTRGEPAANYGLMDVIAALRWVRDNAEAFGGDPDNVTIFGESAGGALVTRLMISEPARGLFQRAVVQSGLGRDEGTPLDRSRRDGGESMQARGEAFAEGLGLARATTEQLRDIPAAKLLSPSPSFYGGDLLVRDGQRSEASRGLSFHRVVESRMAGAVATPSIDGEQVWIERDPVIHGRHVTRGEVTTDRHGRPAIGIRLDGEGARLLDAFTTAHVGERFAVVLDGKILSAPTIRSRITGGSMILQGSFTLAEASAMIDLLSRSQRWEGVTEDVEAAFAAGLEAPVPFVIGTNSAEFWWMKPSDLSPYGALDDAMTSEEQAAFLAAYGGQQGYDQAVLTDLVFSEPARHLARLHARNGHPAWLYRFDVVSAAMPEPHGGATHASERQYVFDNLTASPWATTEMDQAAADAMAGYWTTFAKTGDPNGQGRPAWPAMTGAGSELLEFTNDGPVAKPIPFADRLDLIAAYYARIRP